MPDVGRRQAIKAPSVLPEAATLTEEQLRGGWGPGARLHTPMR